MSTNHSDISALSLHEVTVSRCFKSVHVCLLLCATCKLAGLHEHYFITTHEHFREIRSTSAQDFHREATLLAKTFLHKVGLGGLVYA